MLFVKNLLTIEEQSIESFYIELNLRNGKQLINCCYNPHKNSIGLCRDRLSESLDRFFPDYEKIIIFRDFRIDTDQNHMKSFSENYGLTNLIKQPTCYENKRNENKNEGQ